MFDEEIHEVYVSPFPKAPGTYEPLKAWQNKIYNRTTKAYEQVSPAHFDSLIRGQVYYLAIEAIGGPNTLVDGEARPIYLSHAKWEERESGSTIHSTSSSRKMNFVVVPYPSNNREVERFIAGRLLPDKIEYAHDLEALVTTALSKFGVSILLDRKDISKAKKQEMFLYAIQTRDKKSSHISDICFYDRAGKFFDPVQLGVELLKRDIKPENVKGIVERSTKTKLTIEDTLKIFDGYFSTVPVENQYRHTTINAVNLLEAAIDKVRKATPNDTAFQHMANERIGQKILSFISQRKEYFSKQDAQIIERLIDDLSELHKSILLQKLNQAGSMYLDSIRNVENGKYRDAPGRHALLTALKYSKGNVEVFESDFTAEENAQLIMRAFLVQDILPVMIDPDEPLKKLDLFVYKFKIDLQTNQETHFDKLFQQSGYDFAADVTEEQRIALAVAFVRGGVEVLDQIYNGQVPNNVRGVERFVSLFERSLSDDRKFNKEVIDELYARADVPTKFLMAEKELLGKKRTRKAVTDYSIWKFGKNGAAALDQIVTQRQAGLGDDLERVLKVAQTQ